MFVWTSPKSQKKFYFSFLWETTTAFRARLENLLLLLLRVLRVLRVLRTTKDENAFLTFFYGRRRRHVDGDKTTPL